MYSGEEKWRGYSGEEGRAENYPEEEYKKGLGRKKKESYPGKWAYLSGWEEKQHSESVLY